MTTTLTLYRNPSGRWYCQTSTFTGLKSSLRILATGPVGIEGSAEWVSQQVRDYNPGCTVVVRAEDRE